jgi:hypothetical protein
MNIGEIVREVEVIPFDEPIPIAEPVEAPAETPGAEPIREPSHT